MWDGDGNKYEFGWPVVGYDDSPSVSPGYARDYGRGRDGYYLTSISDPFSNRLLVTYAPDGTSPCPSSCALPDGDALHGHDDEVLDSGDVRRCSWPGRRSRRPSPGS